MSLFIPYTYLIGWSELDRWYYGVRFAKTSNPKDLWVEYFTSSKLVLHYRNMYGEPDIIQVRKTFSTAQEAVVWEEKVLRKLCVLSDERWLNQTIAGAILLHEDTRKIIADKLKGRPGNKGRKASVEAREKMSKAKFGKPSPLKGTKLSDEHKSKLREAKKDYKPWNTGKTKADNPSLSRKGSNAGTRFITDDNKTRRIKFSESIPIGWRYGRTIK